MRLMHLWRCVDTCDECVCVARKKGLRIYLVLARRRTSLHRVENVTASKAVVVAAIAWWWQGRRRFVLPKRDCRRARSLRDPRRSPWPGRCARRSPRGWDGSHWGRASKCRLMPRFHVLWVVGAPQSCAGSLPEVAPVAQWYRSAVLMRRSHRFVRSERLVTGPWVAIARSKR